MRILVNSNPRTGTTYLINMLRWSANHHLDRNRNGEYSNQEEWIIKSHEPLLILANIPGVSQITIVRDPIDTIASNMFRHTSGLNSNSIWGHTGVSNENKTKDYNNPRFLDGLNQSVAKWKEYTENTVSNKHNVTAILFEDLISNTPNILFDIFSKQGASLETLQNISTESIESYTSKMERDLQFNPNHVNGTDNRLPVAKPDEYYEVKDFIINSPYASELVDLYLEVKDTLFK